MLLHIADLQQGFRMLAFPGSFGPWDSLLKKKKKGLLLDKMALRNAVLELPILNDAFGV